MGEVLQGDQATEQVGLQLLALSAAHGVKVPQSFFGDGVDVCRQLLQIFRNFVHLEHVWELGQQINGYVGLQSKGICHGAQGFHVPCRHRLVQGDRHRLLCIVLNVHIHVHLAPADGRLYPALNAVLGADVHSGETNIAIQVAVVDAFQFDH